MEETYYEMDLPRENIHLRCFAHSIMKDVSDGLNSVLKNG